MTQIAERFGGIDVLFANASISECPPLANTDATVFDTLIDVALESVPATARCWRRVALKPNAR